MGSHANVCYIKLPIIPRLECFTMLAQRQYHLLSFIRPIVRQKPNATNRPYQPNISLLKIHVCSQPTTTTTPPSAHPKCEQKQNEPSCLPGKLGSRSDSPSKKQKIC